MKVLEISDSSAIAKIGFSYFTKVMINYVNSPNVNYFFECDHVEDVEQKVEYANDTLESVGELISDLRKSGVLKYSHKETV